MLPWTDVLIRLALASIFGALVGLERARKNWTAGMRTHMMVCAGSCLIMIVSAFGFSDILGTEHVALDPSRIAAQVVTGIGFIGAGTILFQKQGTIRGLTTATGLWVVAAIGLATGAGMYFASGATTIIALIILWALEPLERIYAKRFKHEILTIITDLNVDNSGLLKRVLNETEIKIQSFTLERNDDQFIFELKLDHVNTTEIAVLISELKKDKTVKEVLWSD